MTYLDAGALLDEDGLYRWRLWRLWDASRPRLLWVLLNPSTADARDDDPTLRRCVGYAVRWGYGAVDLVNLFALRSTDPRALRSAADPIGYANDAHIAVAVQAADLVLCA